MISPVDHASTYPKHSFNRTTRSNYNFVAAFHIHPPSSIQPLSEFINKAPTIFRWYAAWSTRVRSNIFSIRSNSTLQSISLILRACGTDVLFIRFGSIDVRLSRSIMRILTLWSFLRDLVVIRWSDLPETAPNPG